MGRKGTREERLLKQLPQRTLFGFPDEQCEQILIEIMHTYQKSLFAYAYKQCGDYDAAHDILQKAWVELYANLSQHGGDGVYGSNVRAWLWRMISNAVVNYHKNRRHYIKLDPSEGMWLLVLRVSPFEHPDTVVTRKEIWEELHEVWPKLSEIQQKVIFLRFFEDRKLEEIAVELEIPLSTVKSHLRRGLLQLRKDIQKVGTRSQELRFWEGYKNRPTIELRSLQSSNKSTVSLIETSNE